MIFLNFSAETQKAWGYAVFANVVAGMDVVDRISQVDTERSGFHRDVPKAPVILKVSPLNRARLASLLLGGDSGSLF
ncbi:hypothetical protein AAUPMB_09866 [Pasteurella multocida subsp. multocida str. Anand1_buffalo]|nr:hypothetical protein AAUPMB_09866 [Pasteurella multocida subsp. multocida str. Anand1_buffalo]